MEQFEGGIEATHLEITGEEVIEQMGVVIKFENGGVERFGEVDVVVLCGELK